MNQVIDRHVLNPDFVYDGLAYPDFCAMVDYWKVLLWEKYQIRSGHRVSLMVTLTDPYYATAVIACLELGVSLVVADKPVNKNFSGVRQRLYGNLDLALFDDLTWAQTDIVECNRQYFNQLGRLSEFDTYTVQDDSLFARISKTTFARPDSIAIMTTTSGSTGVPKVVQRNHTWILDSALRSIRLLDLKKNQAVLHARQLSHGAVLDLFLLPSLIAVDRHYVFNYESNTLDTLIDYLVQYRINKFVVFTQHEPLLKQLPVLDHDLDMFSLITPKKDWVKLVQSRRVNRFISGYGSSEAGNIVFTNVIDKHTDPDQFNPYDYGQLLDDHYTVALTDKSISITVPKFNHTAVLDDVFHLVDGRYHFMGRSNLFRIHDIFFSQAQIDSIVKSFVTVGFEAIIDEPDQKIYLATYDPVDKAVLDLINQSLRDSIHGSISISIMRQVDFDTFNPGFKVTRDVMLHYFRTLDH